MVTKIILLGVSLLLLQIGLYSSSAFAESLYRSVNEKGEVIYSSKPLAGAKKEELIQLQPGPSKADVDAAKQRAMGLKQAIKKSQQREKNRLIQKKKADSEVSRLAEAKRKLQEAKIVRDSDWQFLAKGGRHLKTDYYERIKKAEAEYEAVKKGKK